jgi:hypothetical protein
VAVEFEVSPNVCESRVRGRGENHPTLKSADASRVIQEMSARSQPVRVQEGFHLVIRGESTEELVREVLSSIGTLD